MPKLIVPFFAQNDNDPWKPDGMPGYSQCNITSHAMLLAYLKPETVAWSATNGFREIESYLQSKFLKYSSNRGDHLAMTQTLANDFSIQSEWRYNGTFSDIKLMIDNKIPVVIGVEYKTSGHILIVTGYDDKGVTVNDPYGERHGSTNAYSINYGFGSSIGKGDTYSWDLLDKIWYNGEGWYRFL